MFHKVNKFQCWTLLAVSAWGAIFLNQQPPTAPEEASFAAARKTPRYRSALARFSTRSERGLGVASPTEQQFMARNIACFAPGTDPAIIAAFQDAMAALASQQDFNAISRF